MVSSIPYTCTKTLSVTAEEAAQIGFLRRVYDKCAELRPECIAQVVGKHGLTAKEAESLLFRL